MREKKKRLCSQGKEFRFFLKKIIEEGKAQEDMPYRIFTLKTFDEIYENLDGSEQIWVQNMKKQLETHITGKILHFGWLREKRYRNKRLYYVVDDEQKKVLMIAFASKKEQQKTINQILLNKEELLFYFGSL